VTTTDGRVIALDAKMNVDDSSLYRHKDIAEMRDIHEEEPLEVEASKYDLNYIKLDGNIGCMVNGAGLAMATMDIIKHYGGEPANFLDVGGDASFGGIVRCDMVANGVIAAAKEVKLSIPLVVRLEGTNVEAGRKALAESGLDLIVGEGMADAAEKVVAAVGGAS
jgi:succinyl-CoA synthetase beta subunit